ncbi:MULTISPECIES: DUF2868 domain-containing protein [Pseudomonas]|uniref:DUF2868 domain-containing protein n=1 Tax=Pseudomonas idahonensis TaxID=2942628 RepID=A0ABT5Q2V9_9PSED|nr:MULTISPECIES: DUF2868 domain-containing protein [Pseudomonas]NMY68777.1 DUF2868 domain-containing protein [Pseudomonas sp. WS 5414]MCY7260588.1 DUF2868 domain-containing protein [Pseudomonas protegens]MDD1148533.1 DUF2868 domain-containing protein [Pseudomonas idahonensis]MDP9532043.1 DUF2868 domain-containing protein [Pseudomonas protegens]UZE34585.1 DUF2868 domain-containing protein [Pseudomonas sp. B21-059]
MTALTPLQRLWLTETVRLREEHAGPLDDQEANRLARNQGGDLATRIQTRALWLAQRDGLHSALLHWLQGARLALLMLAVLAVLSGAGLAFSALGNTQQPVNVFWALGSLLGLNLILLLSWLIGLLFAGEHSASLGRLWLWLSEKFSRDAKAAQLPPALLLLLQRRKLNRWALGALVNGLWCLALFSAVVMLLLLLTTHRYSFVWESTLLGADAFVAITNTLSALPRGLGFGAPSLASIQASTRDVYNTELVRQSWAIWLVVLVVIYGVLPRLVLMLFCRWRWKHGLARLQLDLKLPGYSQLRERLMPSSERLGVNDAAPEQLHRVEGGVSAQDSSGALLVAIELDEQRPWPPQLPDSVKNAGILDSRESRNRLLEQMSRFPPARLVIACDPRRSPDRGSLGLIAELARSATATRVWLLQAPPGQALDADRLGDWHTALQQLELPFADCAPLNWLETGHD